MGIYLVLLILISLLSVFVQVKFRNKFSKYAEMQLGTGLSGKEVAEKMLADHGIYNVKIMSTDGQATDYFNPSNKTINLSTDVYYGRSIAAAAVAAHECGHALQQARSYQWLQLRSEMVPLVSISSNLLQWIILFGIVLIGFTGNPFLLGIGVCGLAIITVFSLITLPVEFDASRRALNWLKANKNIMSSNAEVAYSKDALWWAAMTYVVAAFGAVGNLLYYASMLFSSNET